MRVMVRSSARVKVSRVRISGIDAPPSASQYGRAASARIPEDPSLRASRATVSWPLDRQAGRIPLDIQPQKGQHDHPRTLGADQIDHTPWPAEVRLSGVGSV